MLILTRKPDQSILFGDDILIEVLEIKGSYVRLGIKAPKEVKVLRTELLEKDAYKELDFTKTEKESSE